MGQWSSAAPLRFAVVLFRAAAALAYYGGGGLHPMDRAGCWYASLTWITFAAIWPPWPCILLSFID